MSIVPVNKVTKLCMLNLAEHVFPLCKIYAWLLNTLDFDMMDKSTTLAVQTLFVH